MNLMNVLNKKNSILPGLLVQLFIVPVWIDLAEFLAYEIVVPQQIGVNGEEEWVLVGSL
ncbi:hypothetical protein AVEN_173794-1, partial [Araneus ventricosus]